MSGLFYNLGRKVGPKIRKARWIWQSIASTQADAIKMENQVGRDLVQQIRPQLTPYSDTRTGQLLNQIGFRLAGCVNNKYRTFSFQVIEEAESNAFALPGGFIFITHSLVELCGRNSNEMAFILGHEMSHVIRGHAMERIISNSAITAASRATPARGILAGFLKTAGMSLLERSYSREQEFEADKLAMRLVAAAGYNPDASVQLLLRLAESNSKKVQLDIGSYFCTHPPLEIRIRNINRLLIRLKAK